MQHEQSLSKTLKGGMAAIAAIAAIAPPLRLLGGLDRNQNAQGSLPLCGSEGG